MIYNYSLANPLALAPLAFALHLQVAAPKGHLGQTEIKKMVIS